MLMHAADTTHKRCEARAVWSTWSAAICIGMLADSRWVLLRVLVAITLPSHDSKEPMLSPWLQHVIRKDLPRHHFSYSLRFNKRSLQTQGSPCSRAIDTKLLKNWWGNDSGHNILSGSFLEAFRRPSEQRQGRMDTFSTLR